MSKADKAQAGAAKAAEGASAQVVYEALCSISLGAGKRVEMGDAVEISADDAASLLAQGAIKAL